VAQVEAATADWAEWFNRSRLHSSIGYATPMEYEKAWAQASNDIQHELDLQLEGDHADLGTPAVNAAV
ncbi:Integrase core domain-containing protein, partial [Quadrisphaera granulorum]